MLTLPFVETMVTQSCNLSCEGCTNYSDYNVQGTVSWAQGKEWISAWLSKLHIPDFGLIGGEPLLNKEINSWLIGCRELMPNSQIRFTTNGALLVQRSDVLKTMFDIGNCVIKISVHEPNQFYIQQVLNLVFNYAKWEPVEEYGIKRWRADNNVRFQINFPKHFFKTFKGSYHSMLPHNNDPQLAFENCCQQTCPLMYNGRIYKCSSIALLEKTLSDWKQTNPAWQKFLKYQGIGIDSSQEEIKDFIGSFGKSENICAMCPTKNDLDSRLSHADSVISKSQWIQINSR